MPKRIGIFGGSFNPVHTGHCIIGEQFVQQMRLDRCLFIPAYISPFKIAKEEEYRAAMHRLKMVELVARGNERFFVDDTEIQRKGVSYTIDTLRLLRTKYPGAHFFLLIGGDQAKEFTRWREWREILREVQLCIARRPFAMTEEDEQNILNDLTVQERKPIFLTMPQIEISSTSVRQRIERGESVRYLVPDKVARYIRKHRLYTSLTPSSSANHHEVT